MARRSTDPNQLGLSMTHSDWLEPSTLPDLSQEPVVAFDTETKDSGLIAGHGPGWHMGRNLNNYVLGVSLAWSRGQCYIPLYHLTHTVNWPYETVGRYLAALFKQDHTEFVAHNIGYDLGWIDTQWGIKPPKRLHDTVALASFLTESLLTYSLEGVCRWVGIPGKDTRLLEEACRELNVKPANAGENLWRLPGKYVGPYAERDAGAVFELFPMLRDRVREEGSYEAYLTEMELIPVTLAMRRRGIRVDLDRALKVRAEFETARDALLQELREMTATPAIGLDTIRSPGKLAAVFDKMGVGYVQTAKGAPSFDANWMKIQEHPMPKLVTRIRQLDTAANKFIDDYILQHQYKGRIHASINQFKNETGGTRSHRFSYDHPPLQQMPSRDEEMAPKIRSIFLPEQGTDWYAIDYRQQEFRLIVHVANVIWQATKDKMHPRCRGAAEAAQRYIDNPDTDFHDYVTEIVYHILKANDPAVFKRRRIRAKDINFAKAFGAGIGQFAMMANITKAEAEQTMGEYDRNLPFVKDAADVIIERAKASGFIRLIDGARSHYDLWEAAGWGHTGGPVPRHVAERYVADPNHNWYNCALEPGYNHKAFNHLIQGSAARQMKKAMRDIGQAGYLPMIQMHDELGFSFDNPDDARKCAQLMIDAIPLTVPMGTDIEFGPSWGEAKQTLSP